MSLETVSFFAAVLKAIVCTPNRNPDDQRYEERVVAPTREIRRLWEELGDQPMTQAQAEQVLHLLETVFEAKRVDAGERQARMREILEKGRLQNRFPSLQQAA